MRTPVARRREKMVGAEASPGGGGGGGFGGGSADSTWSGDGRHVNFTVLTRASKALYLMDADAASGEARVLAKDSARTWVETSPQDPPSWYVTNDDNDVIWWSERDGWAHLYHFDRAGQLVTINRGFAPAAVLFAQIEGREPAFDGGISMPDEPLRG